MEKQPFKRKLVAAYMTQKSSLIKLVVFTAFFSLCFINLYKPFNSDNWYNVSPVRYFIFSFLLVLTGILVIAFSRFLMYRFVRRHSLYYLEYGLWIVAEIAVLSGIYTFYTIAVNDNLTWWNMEDVITVFKNANINTLLIIMLPYAVSWLYFSYEDKKTQLETISQDVQPETPNRTPDFIKFTDEKGELRFSISSEYVIYIEAADNYVIIKYNSKGKLAEFTLRNSLKSLAEQLKNTNIKRCHRSYMVNLEHVIALRRGNDGIRLEFDIEVKQIPVSRNYNDEITDAFVQCLGKKQ